MHHHSMNISSQTYSVSYEKATQFLECGNGVSEPKMI